MTKQVANRTNEIAGDGTTTASVLTRAIFSEGCKSVAHGVNAMGIRKGVLSAVEKVVSELQRMTVKVNDHNDVKSVATISANGDEEIGELIAGAIDKVGKDGTLTI